jgi:alginate O-acetyltransferase complex protein AlgJ
MTETTQRNGVRADGGRTDPPASAFARIRRLPGPGRFYALVAFALLVLPLVFGILRPDDQDFVYQEGRRLAPAPSLPVDLASWRELPGEVDAYLRDRFGLRHAMIKLHRDLSHPLVMKVNTAALTGRSGRLFYQGNEMLQQSAGTVYRDERVSETVDLLAAMRDQLAARGIRFLVTVPPNSSTIYQDDLPYWAQSRGKPTEYDLFLADLKARGVKTVDLRPALLSATKTGEIYLMNDAHWTARGAIAGFNAVVEADGRPEWRIDASKSLGQLEPRKGGDIARVLGVQDEVSEMTEPLALPPPKSDEPLASGPMPDHVVTTGNPGPTILVIGDSFTASYFPLMLAQHVGRAIWIHHHQCGFDWSAIDKFHPDEVWWAPTERFLICDPHVRPLNFPGTAAG